MKSPEAPGRDQAQQRFVSSTWSKSSPSPPRRVQVDDAIFQITFEQLQEHFHMPLAQVARKFGVGTTFLKKKCRTHGIKRWPFRKIRSQNSQKQEDMYPEGNFDALKVAMCGPPPPPDVDQNGTQNGNHSNATRGAQMIVDAARSSQREPEAAALAALTTLCQAAEAEQQQPPEVEQEEVLPAPVVRDPTPAQRLIPYTLISPPPSFPPAVKGAETTDARTKRERLESMDIQQFSQNSAKKHSLASGAMKAKHLTGCWRLKVDGDGSEDPGSWVLSDGVNSCTTHEFFGANNV